MTNTAESSRNRSFRVPTELLDLLEEESIDKDRSVNWLVVDAIREKFKPQPLQVAWPMQQEDDPVGIATYRAEFRWEMPAYDFTDTIVDEAMTTICGILREHGAENPIEVRGPEHVLPLPLKLDPIPPYVSISGGDSPTGTENSVTRVDPTRKVREDGSLST